MPEGLERIGVHLPSLLAYVINFLVLLGVLYLIAYRPFLRSLRERSRRIQEGLTNADEAEIALTEAEEERTKMLRDARVEAERVSTDALAQAQAKGREAANAYMRKARRDIANEREKMWDKTAEASVDLVAQATEKVLGRELDESDRSKAIKSAVQEIRAMRLPMDDDSQPGFAVVATAAALTSDEWHEVGEAITAMAGKPVRLINVTRPELRGGLTITIGDSFIDASVLGRLQRLHHHLKA